MHTRQASIIAEMNLAGLPDGEILKPLDPLSDAEREFLSTWQTPFNPWGGFGVVSAIHVVEEDGRRLLRFAANNSGSAERAIVTRESALRECSITATMKPVSVESHPQNDRNDCREARAGIVFRMVTSRWYYQFGIEGRRRAVLYRRKDNEWYPLAEQDVTLPDGFVTLQVDLDGDGIRCRCEELDVDFFCTDTMFAAGKVGFRSLKESLLTDLVISANPRQERRNARLAEEIRKETEEAGAGLPDAVLVKTLDLEELGGTPQFMDFAVQDRFDMLIPSADGLRACTAEGEELWRIDEPVLNMTFSTPFTGNGRLIYGFAGKRAVMERGNVPGGTITHTIQDEMIVIRGGDGEVLARKKLPPEEGDMRFYDWSPGSAALQDPEGFDVVLREWRQDLGGGGRRLWAFDRNLNELWHHVQEGAYYGHHYALAFHDIDGDGRDELLAGGVMYRGNGEIIWVHDMEADMLATQGGVHYDAVALGDFSDDADGDPVAFLMGGSCGVYVVDAKTGRTRALHRIGHAQGRTICTIRDDIPGTQIFGVTRWGNYGIITLFSGNGERLWTIQPDYVGQGFIPVMWGGRQLFWTSTSRDVQALYDGHGRKVKDLPALRETYGERRRVDITPGVIRTGIDPLEYLTLVCEGKLHIFGPSM